MILLIFWCDAFRIIITNQAMMYAKIVAAEVATRKDGIKNVQKNEKICSANI